MDPIEKLVQRTLIDAAQSAPPYRRIITPTIPRSRRWLTVAIPIGAAAVTALTVLGLFAALHNADSPSGVSGSGAASAAEGFRLVGLGSVAFSVPETWGTDETRCGRPLADTVAFNSNSGFSCAPDPRLKFTAFRLEPAGSHLGGHWLSSMTHTGELDGHQVYRSEETVSDGMVKIGWAVPDLDVVAMIETWNRDQVMSLMGTAQVLPQAQVCVPYVVAMSPQSAQQILSAAGLGMEIIGDGGTYIAEMQPDAGTVVGRGSNVTVTLQG